MLNIAHQASGQVRLDLGLKIDVHVNVCRRRDPHGDGGRECGKGWQIGS